MKKIRNIFSGNEGFTLIELLIVIVIIGVLAAIAVPNLAGLGDSANVEAVKANMRTLMTELEAHKAQNGDFSDLTGGTTVTLANLKTDNFNGASALIEQNYSGTVISDSATGTYDFSVDATNADGDTVTITINNGSLTSETTSS